MKPYTLLLLSLLLWHTSFSQGVSISQSGSPANASAMLDVSSTNSGVLLTRLTTTQRNAVINPAEGLLIYNVTTHSFNYFTQGHWVEIVAGRTVTSFRISASNFSGGIYTDSRLIGLTPETDFDVWASEGYGGLLNNNDGYTFNATTGGLTMGAGKYAIMIYY